MKPKDPTDQALRAQDPGAAAPSLDQNLAATDLQTTQTTQHGAHAKQAGAVTPKIADSGTREYVKLNNQFVVPVISGTKVKALVVMSLSVEVTAGQKEKVFALEPKLRDAFLQVLFNHANSGGFDGTFTSGQKMSDLRSALSETATKILGPIAADVLVVDIVRQDI